MWNCSILLHNSGVNPLQATGKMIIGPQKCNEVKDVSNHVKKIKMMHMSDPYIYSRELSDNGVA